MSTPPRTATTPPRIVVLVGHPRSGSRTRAVAEAAAGTVSTALVAAGLGDPEFSTLELADILAVSFSDPAVPSRPLADPHDAVRRADVLVVATPAFKGTYTGLLKLYLDHLPHQALAATVAVPVGVAASDSHVQAVGRDLSRLLGELGATIPAPPMLLVEDELPRTREVLADWSTRHASILANAVRTAAERFRQGAPA